MTKRVRTSSRGMGVPPMHINSAWARRPCYAKCINALLLILLLCGCDDNRDQGFDYRMVVQPKYNPMDPSRFFTDGQSARPLPPGTIPINGYENETPMQAV
ncbi:MAG TPA: hypothetical protein VF669_02290, partial [Tepidisphaeraceae bacterium]